MPPPESVRISTRRRSLRGSCASASLATSMYSAAVFDPAFPARSKMAGASPPAPALWSANAPSGWKPNVFFQLGAAFSFSECASTMVASMSTGIRLPSAPGARSPASAQARSRATARAWRIARSARGPSAASVATSRETTGSDATGPHSCGWARSTATSARQSPPSPTVMTRSARIFPGSCTARGARHRPKPSDNPPRRPVTRSASASSSPPA